MKKLFAIVCTLVLGGAMAVAQASSGTQAGTADQTTTTTTKTTKKTTKTSKKHHKGAKKSKKGASSDTTQPPK
jgi:hypothetical protein